MLALLEPEFEFNRDFGGFVLTGGGGMGPCPEVRLRRLQKFGFIFSLNWMQIQREKTEFSPGKGSLAGRSTFP